MFVCFFQSSHPCFKLQLGIFHLFPFIQSDMDIRVCTQNLVTNKIDLRKRVDAVPAESFFLQIAFFGVLSFAWDHFLKFIILSENM